QLTFPRANDHRTPIRTVSQQINSSDQNSSTGLTINLVALSQLQNDPNRDTVVAAFQRAAAIWTARIKTPVTVSINIDYGVNSPGGGAFPAGVLGSTSSRATQIDYPGARTNLIEVLRVQRNQLFTTRCRRRLCRRMRATEQ